MSFIAKSLTAASILTVAAAAAPAFATQVEILGGSFSEGCDPTSAEATVEANGNIQLYLPGLEAVTEPHLPRARKNCQVTLTVRAPHGYAIAPKSVTFDGEAFISPNGSGKASARYFLGGTSSNAAIQLLDSGYTGDFNVTSPDASVRPESWSGCGEVVNFKAQADLIARRAEWEASQSEVIVANGVAQNRITCAFYYRPCH